MFKWPNVFDIWNTYLTKFIHRYVSYKTTFKVFTSRLNPGFFINIYV